MDVDFNFVHSNMDDDSETQDNLYAKIFGVEKSNQVTGLGAGVQWCDVPYIHTEKRGVSRTIEALQATLEEQRLETARKRSEAEKDITEVAQMEEMIRATNARIVEQKFAIQLGRWMKEAGFSRIDTTTQGNVKLMTQVASTQLQNNIPVVQTPGMNDAYCLEISGSIQDTQMN
ncbi:hypothetical protein M0R45_030776 [Rubus argutus]|uniref:Uncharacterized protein n=1 Tax=Rubus argutus TaxID=59490 RepID=A0AAW1WCC3_RUBAR